MWRVVARHVVFKIQSLKTCKVFNRMPFYAVAKGRTPGIFMTWPDCEAQVKGFPGARYKKFDTVVAAQDFINTGGNVNGFKTKQDSINVSTSSNSTSQNLKRSISTTSNSNKKNVSNQSQKKSKTGMNKNTKRDSENDDNFSDDSDGLSTVIAKQMDDIEKRLKSFEKGVDKIINKSVKQTILTEPPQNKRRKTGSDNGFETDDDGFVQVYTDGACSSNGKNGARAGLGVYWGEGHHLNISEPVSGRATNNCGEIQAATKAIKQSIQNGITKLAINTDSKFLINSVTKWMPGEILIILFMLNPFRTLSLARN